MTADPFYIPDELLEYATPEELDEYLQLLTAEAAALPDTPKPLPDSPGALAAQLTDNREAQRKHLDLIDQAYLDLANDRIDRVMVWLPPRVGKTRRAGEFGPLWWLTRHPADPIIYSSYAKGVAQLAGRHVRDLIEGNRDKLDLRLARGTTSQADWETTAGGGMFCVGVAGGLTGRGGQLAIVDDPHKDREEAESALQRDKVADWYSAVLMGRLTPTAKIVIIGHRWHEDDLQGRLLQQEGREEEGGRWRVIHLPALALPYVEDPTEADQLPAGDARRYPDPLGRAPGEPLPHPLIPPTDVQALRAHWAEKRRSTTPRDWVSLYQGTPGDSTGKLVSWAQLRAARLPGNEVPEARRVAVAVDPSGGGDNECGIIGGRLGVDGRAYVTHDRSDVMSADRWGRAACSLAYEIGADVIVVERNYGGDQAMTIIRQAWDAMLRDEEVTGLPPRVSEVTAKRGKAVRADPVGQAIAEGRVGFAGLFPELEAQWATYTPGDDSPDRLDASVYLVLELLPPIGGGGSVVAPGRTGQRMPTRRAAFGAGGAVRAAR